MRIEYDDDGVPQVFLRQSSINTFLMCPERARYDNFIRDQDKEYYTDASALGQAFHSCMEELGKHNIVDAADFAAHGRLFFRNIERKHGIDYVQKDRAQCLKYFDGWSKAVFHSEAIMDIVTHPEIQIEVPFCFKVGDGLDYGLWFEGKMDVVLPQGVTDYKTAASAYREHEHQRWDVQPSMYVMAAQKIGLTDSDRFWYVVMPKKYRDVKPQIVPITRTAGHTAFLIEQAWRIAEFIVRYGTDVPWPLVDQHWLCSEKWCGHWADCKGKFLTIKEKHQ